MDLPLGTNAWRRQYAGEPEIRLINRIFEQNPTNQAKQTALLKRPGSTLENVIGTGPIRAMATQPGMFTDDLMVVSGTGLYRYAADGTITDVVGTVAFNGTPSMTFVKGAGYERLFIADGSLLQWYGGQAWVDTLTLTPGAIVNDVVVIDGVHYQFAAAPVGAGDGTAVTPYKVNRGSSNLQAFANLRSAINASGVDGTTYSSGLEANERVESNAHSSTTLAARARFPNLPEPPIAASVIAVGGADGLAWADASFQPGPHVLYGVAMPDSVAANSVATLASHVLVSVGNSQRFYWLRPGEIVIDPLDFAEAESAPDDIDRMLVVGDQVWMFGDSSTEAWYATGDLDAPFAPVQGRGLSRGVLSGTPVLLNDKVFLVGNDGIVYRVSGGFYRISHNGIEERIRTALKLERDVT